MPRLVGRRGKSRSETGVSSQSNLLGRAGPCADADEVLTNSTEISGDGNSTTSDTFLSASSFWIPDRIEVTSAWIEHAPFAFWLIDVLRPRRLVELGTHYGYSYLAFCQAVHRCGLATSCFAIDTWKGDEHSGFYGEEVYDRLRAYHDDRYRGFSQLVRLTFANAVEYFEDRSIDILHIDGRHFYDDVKTDFETWRPKLSDRAVVIFHDINVRERNFGVWRLWCELRMSHPGFDFVHGHGLGVLGVGTELPLRVKALLSIKGSLAADRVRSSYARLGAAIADRLQLDLLRGDIATRERQLLKQEAEAAQRNAELAALREAVEQHVALNEALSSARQEAADLRSGLGAAAAGLQHAEEGAAGLRAELAEREATAEALQAEMATLRGQLAASRQVGRDLIAALRADILSAPEPVEPMRWWHSLFRRLNPRPAKRSFQPAE
jgi:O-antigen biosynthesis protein